MKKNQKIGCNVESCKFQNKEEECCNLEEIKVSCDCGCHEVDSKLNTICDSFECDNEKIEKSEN